MKHLLARLLRRWADRLDPPVSVYKFDFSFGHLPPDAVIDEVEVSALWAAGDDGKLWYSRDGQPAVQVEWPEDEEAR